MKSKHWNISLNSMVAIHIFSVAPIFNYKEENSTSDQM